jgi:hypothetical protein
MEKLIFLKYIRRIMFNLLIYNGKLRNIGILKKRILLERDLFIENSNYTFL